MITTAHNLLLQGALCRRGADLRGAVRKHLPLHRLSVHCGGGDGGAGRLWEARMKLVGRPVPRAEDDRFLRGTGQVRGRSGAGGPPACGDPAQQRAAWRASWNRCAGRAGNAGRARGDHRVRVGRGAKNPAAACTDCRGSSGSCSGRSPMTGSAMSASRWPSWSRGPASPRTRSMMTSTSRRCPPAAPPPRRAPRCCSSPPAPTCRHLSMRPRRPEAAFADADYLRRAISGPSANRTAARDPRLLRRMG